MPVTSCTTDRDDLTVSLVAELDAPVDRVWAAFTDPRQIERFWGPPTWPATFTHVDFRVGGTVEYHMTGPRGEIAGGHWTIVDIDPGRSFAVIDRFVTDGEIDTSLPTTALAIDIVETPTGSRVAGVMQYDSPEALAAVLELGGDEGWEQAFGQLDDVLTPLRDRFAGRGTEHETISDTDVRITRLIDAPRARVAEAYLDPELLAQWMLGPDGWRLVTCEISPEFGAQNRYEWEPEPGTDGERFGFEGETLFVDLPARIVTTERPIGAPIEPAINDLTLYEEDGATLMTLIVSYPDRDTRDVVLGTGMLLGMEASYARLERLLTTGTS